MRPTFTQILCLKLFYQIDFRVTSFRAFSEDKKANIESLENDFNFLIKDLKELDALWMTEMKVLEKRLSIDISRYKSSSKYIKV